MQATIRAGMEHNNSRFTDLLKLWDADRDGTVSRREFADGVLAMGIPGSRADFNALFDLWDVDGGGTIDAKELKKALDTNETVEDAKRILEQRKLEKNAPDAITRQKLAAAAKVKAARTMREDALEEIAEALREAAGRGDLTEITSICAGSLPKGSELLDESGAPLVTFSISEVISRPNIDGCAIHTQLSQKSKLCGLLRCWLHSRLAFNPVLVSQDDRTS